MNLEGACISFGSFRTFCEPRSSFRDFTTKKASDVCLHPRNRQGIFRGGVRTQQYNLPFLRPTPARIAKEPEPRCQGSGPKKITHHATVDGAQAWGRRRPPP